MQQMVSCPNCGSQNAANQQFCVSCGAHLIGSSRQTSHVPIVTAVAVPPLSGATMAPQNQVLQALPAVSAQSRQVDVKPTWGLAWGLFWRTICILVLIGLLGFLGYMLVRMALGYTSVFGGF
jgi:hypothetical protein